MKQTKKTIKLRRHRRIRSKVVGTAERPRISVFKSTRYTYLQAIDDTTGKTIAYASTRSQKPAKEAKVVTKEKEGFQTARMAAAFTAGKVLGEQLKAAHIKKGVFDRGGFQYTAIVKSAAEGVRAGGITL